MSISCLKCQDSGWYMEQLQMISETQGIVSVPVLTQCSCDIGKQQCIITREEQVCELV